MKKLLSILMSLALLCAMAACGREAPPEVTTVPNEEETSLSTESTTQLTQPPTTEATTEPDPLAGLQGSILCADPLEYFCALS